jgi:hypothetical protein
VTGAQLIRRLNKKDGKGSWRIRTVCGRKRIERRVTTERWRGWVFWLWATESSIAAEAADRLPQEDRT